MGKMLVGVLIGATVISAIFYDKAGLKAESRLASASAPGGPATAQAPRAPAATAVPVDTVALASFQPAEAPAPAVPAKATRLVESPPPVRATWVVPTVAAPAPGMNLPANFPPPTDE